MVKNGYGKALILSEIKKCIPLCANCHAIRHYDEDYVHSGSVTIRIESGDPEFDF